MMQHALDFSRAVGEEAGERCADKAERVASFDREGAAKFIYGYLIRHGQQTGETLTDEAIRHGYRCHDARAYGPVYAGLVRRNKIRCVGYAARRKGNGTAGARVWEAVL